MAAVQLVLALDILAQLDRELGAFVGDAHTVLATSDPLAVERLRAGLADLEATRLRVRDRVVASVTADDLEWRETIVHTRIFVVLAQLSMLADAVRDLPPGSQPFGDRFESVEALHASLVGRIGRIFNGLRRECEDIAAGSGSREGRVALLRVVFGKAESGFVALGRDPQLTNALVAGTRMPVRRFAVACRTLLLALGEARGFAADDVPELPALIRASRKEPS